MLRNCDVSVTDLLASVTCLDLCAVQCYLAGAATHSSRGKNFLNCFSRPARFESASKFFKLLAKVRWYQVLSVNTKDSGSVHRVRLPTT